MTRYRTVINSGGCQGTVDMPVWVVRGYAGMPKPGPAEISQQRGAFDPGRLAPFVCHD